MQTLRDQLVGQTIGEYRVERLLGRGRLSAVYLAQDPIQRNSVALTTFIIPEQFSSDARARFIARFHKEAAALVALQHRHLLPIHAYGEYSGLPYLVTPYMMHGSLADVLKQRGRCQPAYVLSVLEQIASGLEYAHRRGVVHGSLKPANLLLDGQHGTLVAGFGLMQILQLRDIEQSEKPYAHLLNVAGTFLGSPEYLAPEVVMGHRMDTRSDIYALGIVLFELLCGKPPFAGGAALEVAQRHVNEPLPSLRSLCPDIPIALELVITHALERNPALRFQHTSELVEAFAQVCRGTMPLERIDTALRDPAPSLPGITDDTDKYSGEDGTVTGKWQLMPPVVTGKLAAVQPSTGSTRAIPHSTDKWQIVPPVITGKTPIVKPSAPLEKPKSSYTAPVPAQNFARPVPVEPVIPPQPVRQSKPMQQPMPLPPQSARQVMPQQQPMPMQQQVRQDPAAPLVLSGPLPTVPPPTAQPFAQPPAGQGNNAPAAASYNVREGAPALPWWSQGEEMLTMAEQARPNTTRLRQSRRGVSRRKAIALLAVSGVAVVGAAIAVDLNLGYLKNALTPHTNNATSNGKSTPANNKGTGGQNGQTHTGHVIGSTTLALNASANFTNPADGKASLLVHLPNNTFVAYEKACTHQGVPVYYDKGTQKLVCPLHGSIFDPAHGGKVLQGPATLPLPNVAIHVNADGTITTL